MTATKTIPLKFTTEFKQQLPPVMNNVLEAIGNTPMVKIQRLYKEFSEADENFGYAHFRSKWLAPAPKDLAMVPLLAS